VASRHRVHLPSEHSALGERFRLARLKAGLTQVELAERMGISQSQVGKIERGERVIAALELRDACREFGISISSILEDLMG